MTALSRRQSDRMVRLMTMRSDFELLDDWENRYRCKSEQHLTPQRSNGVRAMIERIRSTAAGVLV